MAMLKNILVGVALAVMLSRTIILIVNFRCITILLGGWGVIIISPHPHGPRALLGAVTVCCVLCM